MEVAVGPLEARVEVGGGGDEEQLHVDGVQPEGAGHLPQAHLGPGPLGRIPDPLGLGVRHEASHQRRLVVEQRGGLLVADVQTPEAVVGRRIASAGGEGRVRVLPMTKGFGPESVEAWTEGYRSGPAYHVLGVEARSPVQPGAKRGPGWTWFRLKLPVVPGEQPSGLVRICAAADFPNGISNVVEPSFITYVNPDLTIYMHRLPVDEWVLVDARTWLEAHGTGMAEGALYDRRGRLGRSLQSLLVEPRQSPKP